MKIKSASTNSEDIYYQDRLLAVTPFDKIEFAKTFEHRRAIHNGVDIHYVIGGTGPVIFFGHGWPASWYEWRKVLPQLADSFTCIAMDFPGLGDSDPLPEFSDKTVADFVHGFITETLGIDEVFLVGHDVSGPGLVYMSAHYPELVKKLFLTETAIMGPEMGEVLAQHVTEIWHFPINAARLSATLTIGREEQIIPQYFTKWVYNPAAIMPEDIDEYVRTNKIPGVVECGAAYYHKPASPMYDGQALPKDSLSMPIHFVAAELGFGGRLGGAKKAAFKTIDRFATDASYEVLDKCGHWISEDRPVTIAKKMKEFFSK